MAALAAAPAGHGPPLRYLGWNSPYYNESHCEWRLKIRKLVEEHLSPYASEWDAGASAATRYKSDTKGMFRCSVQGATVSTPSYSTWGSILLRISPPGFFKSTQPVRTWRMVGRGKTTTSDVSARVQSMIHNV